MQKYVYVCAALTLCACSDPVTSKYKITYNSAQVDTDALEKVAPQIDLAMDAALAQHGADAQLLQHQFISVYFSLGPINVMGEKLYGADTQTQVETQFSPCLFDPDSALVHEFLHLITYLETREYDPGHTAAYWHAEPAARAALQAQSCKSN